MLATARRMTSAFVVASVDPTRSESVLSNSLSKSMVYLGILKSYCIFTAQRKTRGNPGKDACSNRFSYPDFPNALLISNSYAADALLEGVHVLIEAGQGIE